MFLLLGKLSFLISNHTSFKIIYTIGFATTYVVVFVWNCKTSYHLLISPPPTNLANTLKIHTGENKIDRLGR